MKHTCNGTWRTNNLSEVNPVCEAATQKDINNISKFINSTHNSPQSHHNHMGI